MDNTSHSASRRRCSDSAVVSCFFTTTTNCKSLLKPQTYFRNYFYNHCPLSLSITMSSSNYFRRRTMGRAASPPTWACYEQIQDDNSDSDSCSEDDEDYNEDSRDRDSSDNEQLPSGNVAQPPPAPGSDNSDDIDMDMDEDGSGAARKDVDVEKQKDVKGKQRAVDPEPEAVPRRQRKKQQRVYTLRPILTIHKSQGFVWNQDLFVPPYIKDRYIASTSPPNARGFAPSSVSSNSTMADYEVEVVEIRVREGEIYDIIP
ncbi:hypothetical protein CPB83DRAFT_847225 [Crepidotus variabilis]|uniref:Uncharacterized protein n=1 Tax=Crepidotus variabilis TaxID=179855 RepID=A0A9P6EPT5_9AGAR|nr:hypothetical protein CPB83DRAFT_847225 [Crepidotus variabilis]